VSVWDHEHERGIDYYRKRGAPMKPDPTTTSCHRDFFPAVHTSGTRKLDEIWWIIMHDEEAPTARGAAEWFRNDNSGGSAHLCVDDQTCYRCLRDIDIPWGAKSAPQIMANLHGFHIEQAGYAKWSAVLWMGHKRTLDRGAFKAALHLKKFGLPVQFCDAVDLIHHKKGVTTHAEVTKASKKADSAHAWKYTHTDPGLLWPRAWFMRRVQQFYAEL
jgi:hypothetical protein